MSTRSCHHAADSCAFYRETEIYKTDRRLKRLNNYMKNVHGPLSNFTFCKGRNGKNREKKGNHHYHHYSISTVLSIQVSLVAQYGSVSLDSDSDWKAN